MQGTTKQEAVRCAVCEAMVRVVRSGEGGARRLAFHTRRRKNTACTGSGMAVSP